MKSEDMLEFECWKRILWTESVSLFVSHRFYPHIWFWSTSECGFKSDPYPISVCQSQH